MTVTPLSADDLQWIESHSAIPVASLMLKHGGDSHLARLITQIEARRKGAAKVAGELKAYPGFIFPTTLSAEQCTTDSIADYHAGFVKAGETVVDMTCGLGIDAFHLARAGASVTAFDLNPDIAAAASLNAAGLGLSDRFKAVAGDSLEYLQSMDSTIVDMIFVDPARRGEGGRRLYALKECSPDVVTNLPLILSRCRRLVVKASPMLDITAVANELPASCHADIIAVGTTGECKELVIAIPGTDRREAVTVNGKEIIVERFMPADTQPDIRFSLPAVGDFLHEPYPAVLKCGMYSCICDRYKLDKIGRNVHLYHGPEPAAGFPGHIHPVVDILPFGKKEVRQLLDKYGRLSVTTRDFPLTAAEFKKRFKTGESDTHRLWAVNTQQGKMLIVTGRSSR